MSGPTTDCGPWLRRALAGAVLDERPFRHWTLQSVLPAATCTSVLALPFAVPAMADIAGKRENINSQRSFFSATNRVGYPVCDEVARAFQAPETVALVESTCGISLAGAFLRIEYAQDANGFWLEPHTDIGAKLFTMLAYLSTHPDAQEWGTDLLWPDFRLATRTSGTFGSALFFVPGANTWHGFAPRRIAGVRHSLIVNYVVPDWRSRDELAFPDHPVG
jgi:hypothetical protein